MLFVYVFMKCKMKTWVPWFSGFGDFASNFFSGFSGNKHHRHSNNEQRQSPSSFGSEGSGGMLGVAILLLLAYGVYKLFLSGNSVQGGHQEPQPGNYPTGHDDSGYTNGPPPPGFKPNFSGKYYLQNDVDWLF